MMSCIVIVVLLDHRLVSDCFSDFNSVESLHFDCAERVGLFFLSGFGKMMSKFAGS